MTQSAFAPVFPGWNVWNVWQVKDLPFDLMMIGVSRDRQLRLWVEDELRLHSAADVADPLDLKGGQIEIIEGPNGLKEAMRKEDVPSGAIFLVNGPADLRTVRFFNKGSLTQLAWPHDESYLLDAVFQPNSDNAATSGPAPTTIGGTVGTGITKPISDAVGGVPWYLWAGAAIITAAVVVSSLPVRTVRKLGTRNRKK